MSSNINEEDEEKETSTNEQLDKYSNVGFCEYIRSGSSAEQLYLPFPNHSKSDIDLMFEFPHLYVVDPEQITTTEREQYKDNTKNGLLYIEYSNKTYPCYVTLYFQLTQEWVETSEPTDSSCLLPGTNIHITPGKLIDPCKTYFPSSKFVSWFKNKWSVDETYDEKLEIHGPSICLMSTNPNLPLPMDHVPVLKCIHWPQAASNWPNRPRSANWPDKNLIDAVVKYGCHIVPVSHVLSDNETRKHEWRLSFSICEILLAKSLGCYQRKCYLIIKALFDVHIKQDEELSKVVCSYYLKTSLYWLCESLKKEIWTYETLYDRFIDFIDYLITCFENKHLKHYFIPEVNLIAHIDFELSKKISERCIVIKNDLPNMIRLCEEHYWNTNQFKRFDPIIEALTKNENLDDYSCIVWCCANTMHAFLKQHKETDRPLKMVNDCIKRHYLQSCSNESAKFLLYVTSLIADILLDENECSVECLTAHDAMIKICDIKAFGDQSYDIMQANYIEIKNKLASMNS